MSVLIREMVNDDDDDDIPEIPLPNVSKEILEKVIEFCQHHVSDPMTEIEKPIKSNIMSEICADPFDADFIDLELATVFDIILAANYLDIGTLLELACAKVATRLKGKTPEEMRKTFNIQNDFTPEEYAQVVDENRWADESPVTN